MKENRPTLLWGYDEQTNRIQALPASPLLLPGVVFLGVLKLVSLFHRPKQQTAPLPDSFNLEEYHKNKTEYRRLWAKKQSGQELTDYEFLRWTTIKHPSWSKGEPWHY